MIAPEDGLEIKKIIYVSYYGLEGGFLYVIRMYFYIGGDTQI